MSTGFQERRRVIPAASVTMVAISVWLMSGCASPASSPPEPSTEPLSSAEAEQIAEEYLESYRDRVMSSFPNAQLPDVERVRFIEPEEYAVVISECMNDAGFPAVANRDNTISYGNIPSEQAEAQSVTLYSCMAQYPTNPERIRPFTDSQLSYLYTYSKDVLVPCLREMGFETDPLPSQQRFSETFGTASGWYAYSTAIETDPDQFIELMGKCPQYPDELWG